MHDPISEQPKQAEPQNRAGLGHAALRAIQSQMTPQTFLRINYFNFFWVFTVASILGLVVENLFHIVVYGFYESRAGLVWGPFSPVYGVAAVVMTMALDRFCKAHNLFIFLLSAFIGSAVEFTASVIMQYCWGAIAWDYTGTFGSIGGRTNLLFAAMWGTLGLVWVHVVLPGVKTLLGHFDSKGRFERILTTVVTIYLAADIVVTSVALDRESQRKADVPATTPLQQVMDEYFPDDYLEARFHNLVVTASAQDAQPHENSYDQIKRQEAAA